MAQNAKKRTPAKLSWEETERVIDGLRGSVERHLQTIENLRDRLQIASNSEGAGHIEALIDARRAFVGGRTADGLYHLDRVLASIDSAWRTRA